MKSHDAILVALIVVLLVVAVHQSGGGGAGRGSRHAASRSGPAEQGGGGGSCDGFTGLTPNPRHLARQAHLDAIRGVPRGGFNQPPAWVNRQGRGRSGAVLRPEDISEAEREQWFAASGADSTGSFNTELAQDAQTDTMQYHTAQPSIDYSGYITDLVVDPRTRDNHRRWADEMKPWSGAAMMVDDMDEAMEASTDFVGLRRPQAIVQDNPLQLTERDSSTYAANAKFNFKG